MHKQKCLESRGFVYRSIWSCQWRELKRQQQEAVQQALNDFCHVAPMNIRDALFGGRTEAFRLLALPDSSKGEYVSYLDKNSLYPAVCKQKSYPLGIPEKILSNFKPLEEYFGIAHVRILPPVSLHLPVLPQRINNKCLFTLCWRCAELNNQDATCGHTDEQRCFNGVYTTPELTLAMSLGYTLIKIHEIWHYPRQGDLFSHYISTFMAEKAAASGYPAGCISDSDKRAYLQLLYERDGVVVDPSRMENNPTKRLLSKLMLNTLWGRLAIKENKTRFEYVKDMKRFNDLFYSGTYNVSYVDVLSDDVLQVQSSFTCDVDGSDLHANVVIASFVTSYARLELYAGMAYVGIERLLYVDTDCVIALEGQNLKSLPVGECLGEFKSEIGEDQIIVFVCGGPKMYAYRTRKGSEVFKLKGISINQGNKDLFTVDTLEKMVRDPRLVKHSVNPYKIFRIKGKWQLKSSEQRKVIRFTFDKRRILEDFRTVPFGYHPSAEV
ncbi:uncharacterized protein LOC129592914 [Paramacrobiotus metropolitanus]|uniref:uncharacterized protein LOC129592914 n=1 Tax=Paramacrobiotus metropolitanus TaxID=2943436 RepID=UPI002445EAF1|nr:uncharacterized protein LOC129592914 [Paramacrobiotus metropolitanus]